MASDIPHQVDREVAAWLGQAVEVGGCGLAGFADAVVAAHVIPQPVFLVGQVVDAGGQAQVFLDAPLAAQVAHQPQPAAQQSPWREQAPREPNLIERGIAAAKAWLFGGNTVLRVGVVLLFLGLAFLLRYATEGMVVPIELRYAGVAAAAAVNWATAA
mgnify:CR=1 FL=1